MLLRDILFVHKGTPQLLQHIQLVACFGRAPSEATRFVRVKARNKNEVNLLTAATVETGVVLHQPLHLGHRLQTRS